MAEICPKFIREFMPQQHRDFFQYLTMLFVAYNDSRLLPCASILFGDVNFITSPTDNVRFSLSSKVTGRIRRYLKKID